MRRAWRDASRLWVALLAALLPALTGCGERAADPGASAPAAWRLAPLAEVPIPTAATWHEGRLYVLGAGQRALYVIDVPGSALGGGGSAAPSKATRVPLDVTRTNPLEGHGSGERAGGLAGQGYTLGVLWDQPLEFVGLAVRRVRARGAGQDVEALYVLERTYGVVWWGRLERDARGGLSAAHLTAAFVVAGRPRAGAAGSDWRDSGPGLAALALAGGLSKDDDLIALARTGQGAQGPRLDLLDRFGMRLGGWEVDPGVVGTFDVRALAWDGARHVLLLGPGRGTLHLLPGSGASARLRAEPATPDAPPDEADVAWSALAAGDGRLFVLGARAQTALLAWR